MPPQLLTFEELSKELQNPSSFAAYKVEYDNYKTALIPRLLGKLLIISGNLVYGKEPSYGKFRAVEVIARVPYHSWVSACYTLITLFYTNEHKALTLGEIKKYARHAQDNETMHVVVISQLAKEDRLWFIKRTFIPLLFAFFYFWMSYLLYLIHSRSSYELNYLFEQHAFSQYDRFLTLYEKELREKPIQSEFLTWYGRSPANQYEFFHQVRNDELIHRNTSLEHIAKNKKTLSEHYLKN